MDLEEKVRGDGPFGNDRPSSRLPKLRAIANAESKTSVASNGNYLFMSMINLVSRLKTLSVPTPRLRDRRAFWASSSLADRRDMYWDMTGETPTNPPEFASEFRMKLGDAIEKALVEHYFSKMHLEQIHLIATQVQVGANNPIPWDGYVDVYLAERTEDGKLNPYVVEVKTKWGFGADLLGANPTNITSNDYFYQLGLYLKDFYDKKYKVDGCLFFVLLSNDHFGEVLQYHCEYVPESNSIRCTTLINNAGDKIPMNLEFCLDDVFDRWKELQKCLDEKKCPPPDYRYKYPLTPDVLASLTDKEIYKAAMNGTIIGDWQPKYSKYKTKILETDGEIPFYTDQEMELLVSEYERRVPRSPIRKKVFK